MLKMKHDLNLDESEDDDDDDDDSKASDFSMYSDGYDDDGPYSNKRRKCELKYSTKEVSLFFNSLIKNEVFDMGFRVWGLCPDDDTNCWCPCGKHMVAWRECVVVEHLAGKGCDAYCNATSKMTPLGKISFFFCTSAYILFFFIQYFFASYYFLYVRPHGASRKER